jgi:hypothetical protein
MDPFKYEHHLTVGQLREAMEGLPDEAPVFYQRIEDVYFADNGWRTVQRPSLDVPGQSTDYIRAYWALTRGEKALFIEAHY